MSESRTHKKLRFISKEMDADFEEIFTTKNHDATRKI